MAEASTRPVSRIQATDGQVNGRPAWPPVWVSITGWERLRLLGRVRPVVIAALVLIPVLFYGLELYNNEVATIRQWARVHGGGISDMLRDWLHPIVIPSQSLLLMISILLLVAGTFLYTLVCPGRVRDFSREQWCFQLGRPVAEYLSASAARPLLRLICTLCSAAGILGALWILVGMLWHTFWYLSEQAPFSLY